MKLAQYYKNIEHALWSLEASEHLISEIHDLSTTFLSFALRVALRDGSLVKVSQKAFLNKNTIEIHEYAYEVFYPDGTSYCYEKNWEKNQQIKTYPYFKCLAKQNPQSSDFISLEKFLKMVKEGEFV
jgi:hypothetical protein